MAQGQSVFQGQSNVKFLTGKSRRFYGDRQSPFINQKVAFKKKVKLASEEELFKLLIFTLWLDVPLLTILLCAFNGLYNLQSVEFDMIA